jgi:transmembrane sensor
MNTRENWSLIALYLSKAASPEEERALLSWASESPENQNALDEAIRVWGLTGNIAPMPEVEITAEWDALMARIDAAPPVAEGRMRKLVNAVGAPLKIAASIILILFVYWLLRPAPVSPQQNLPELLVISTSDSVKRYLLPDSSLVWMNTHSSLTFDSAFSKREVILKGEAYFHVTSNENRSKFIVIAQRARVTVLGTEFNVDAKDDKPVVVTVLGGHVEFAASDSVKKVVLGPGERGTLNPLDSAASKAKNSDKTFLEWWKNNSSLYDAERRQPKKFVKNSYTYKKNKINETQIEGRLTNTASIASYGKIKLRIRSTNARGKTSETMLDVSGKTPLLPGKSIQYKKTLFDVLSGKTDVTVAVEAIEVVN